MCLIDCVSLLSFAHVSFFFPFFFSADNFSHSPLWGLALSFLTLENAIPMLSEASLLDKEREWQQVRVKKSLEQASAVLLSIGDDSLSEETLRDELCKKARSVRLLKA